MSDAPQDVRRGPRHRVNHRGRGRGRGQPRARAAYVAVAPPPGNGHVGDRAQPVAPEGPQGPLPAAEAAGAAGAIAPAIGGENKEERDHKEEHKDVINNGAQRRAAGVPQPRRQPWQLHITLTAQQQQQLNVSFPNLEFEIMPSSTPHPHPVSATERAIAEQKIYTALTAANAHYIVDIGGNPKRHRAARRNNVWSLCPDKSAHDVTRNATNTQLAVPNWCRHAFPDCECRQAIFPDAYMAIHSIYYLSLDLVVRAVHGCRKRILMAACHTFDAPVGVMWGGNHSPEASYYVTRDNTVVMSVNGNDAPYRHPNPSWLRAGSAQVAGRIIAWNLELEIGQHTKIYKFVDSTVFVPHPISKRQLLSTALHDSEYYGDCEFRGAATRTDLSLNPIYEGVGQVVSYGASVALYGVNGDDQMPDVVPKALVAAVSTYMIGRPRSPASLRDCIEWTKKTAKLYNMPDSLRQHAVIRCACLGYTNSITEEQSIMAFHIAGNAHINTYNSALNFNFGWAARLSGWWRSATKKLKFALLAAAVALFRAMWCIKKRAMSASFVSALSSLWGKLPTVGVVSEIAVAPVLEEAIKRVHPTFAVGLPALEFVANVLSCANTGRPIVCAIVPAVMHFVCNALPYKYAVGLHSAWNVFCNVDRLVRFHQSASFWSSLRRFWQWLWGMRSIVAVDRHVVDVPYPNTPAAVVDAVRKFNHTYVSSNLPHLCSAVSVDCLRVAGYVPPPIVSSDLDVSTQIIVPVDAKPTAPTVMAIAIGPVCLSRMPTVAQPCFESDHASLVIRACKRKPEHDGLIVSEFVNWVQSNIRELMPGIDKIRPIDFKVWNSKFPAARAQQHVEAKARVDAGEYTVRDAVRTEFFTKIENTLKSSPDGIDHYAPRSISGAKPEHNVIFSPWMCAFSDYVKRIWHVDNPIVYASGLRADVIGQWFHNSSLLFKMIAEDDFSNFDATIYEELMLLLIWIYLLGGMPREAADIKLADIKTRGLTKLFFFYVVWRTIKSGRGDTSTGNSMLNVFMHLFTYCRQHRLTVAVALREIRMIVLGDDNLFFHNRPKTSWDLLAALGMKSKVVTRIDPDQAEFCSSLFYPTTLANGVTTRVMAPKIGRILAKSGWEVGAQQSASNYKCLVRGNALGMINDATHVPILSAFLTQLVRITSGSRSLMPQNYEYKSHVEHPFPMTEAGRSFVRMRYDITDDDIEEMSRFFTTLTLPCVMSHPVIDRILDVDVPVEPGTKPEFLPLAMKSRPTPSTISAAIGLGNRPDVALAMCCLNLGGYTLSASTLAIRRAFGMGVEESNAIGSFFATTLPGLGFQNFGPANAVDGSDDDMSDDDGEDGASDVDNGDDYDDDDGPLIDYYGYSYWQFGNTHDYRNTHFVPHYAEGSPINAHRAENAYFSLVQLWRIPGDREMTNTDGVWFWSRILGDAKPPEDPDAQFYQEPNVPVEPQVFVPWLYSPHYPPAIINQLPMVDGQVAENYHGTPTPNYVALDAAYVITPHQQLQPFDYSAFDANPMELDLLQ